MRPPGDRGLPSRVIPGALRPVPNSGERAHAAFPGPPGTAWGRQCRVTQPVQPGVRALLHTRRSWPWQRRGPTRAGTRACCASAAPPVAGPHAAELGGGAGPAPSRVACGVAPPPAPDFLRSAAAAAAEAPRARGYLFISGPRALIMEPLSAEAPAAAAAAAVPVPPLLLPGRSLLCGRAAGMDLSLRLSC